MLDAITPMQAEANGTNTSWMPNTAVGPSGQQALVGRPIAGLSTGMVALGTAFRQDLDPIRSAIHELDAVDQCLLANLDEERSTARNRHWLMMENLNRMEVAADAVHHDVRLLSLRISDSTRQPSAGRTALVTGIDDLDLRAAAFVVGCLALICILLFRNRPAGRSLRPQNTVPSAQLQHQEKCPSAGAMPRDVEVESGRHPASLAAGLPSPVMPFDGILDSKTLLQRLVVEAKARTGRDATLQIATDTRAVATATDQGHIRHDNQDYHTNFKIGDYEVVILGDGCGGLAHGATAAYVAVRAAAAFLLHLIGTPGTFDPVVSTRQALLNASDALAQFAASAVPPIREGLRTTLIVIIADAKRFAFAYIGDGGGVIVRKSGAVEKFLFPQKAGEDMPNVLAASLGPVMEGEPASGAVPRYPGDLLMAGTDGVWDFVGPLFPRAVAQALANHDGDVQVAAESVIRDLADHSDSDGYICTDNLTLGLISDPVRASMPPIRTRAGAVSHDDNTATKQEAQHDQN